MSSKESRSCGSPRRCSHFHPPCIFIENTLYIFLRESPRKYTGVRNHVTSPPGPTCELRMGRKSFCLSMTSEHIAPSPGLRPKAPEPTTLPSLTSSIRLPRRSLAWPSCCHGPCLSRRNSRGYAIHMAVGEWEERLPFLCGRMPFLAFHFISFHFCIFSSHKGAPARILRGPRSRGNPSRPRCACCSYLRVVTTLGLS